jgi:hypothetical protein
MVVRLLHLVAELMVLRHEVAVLRRRAPVLRNDRDRLAGASASTRSPDASPPDRPLHPPRLGVTVTCAGVPLTVCVHGGGNACFHAPG